MSQLTIQQAIDLGLEHHRAGRLNQAEQMYRQVLAAHPNHPWAIQLLGMIAHQVGNTKLGIDLVRRAIAIEPNAADFHNNLGEMLRVSGMLDEAQQSFHRCLGLNPNFAAAYNNLGEVYRERGELERAAEQYRKAIELEPDSAAPYNNLGIATHDMGDPVAAIELYQKAISLGENYVDAHNNLATSYLDLRRMDEAMGTFNRALAMDPNNPDAHSNRAYALLLQGEFERGWEEYEWRWKCPKFPSPRRGFRQPLWNGEDPSGKRILVYAEQGLGDTIQFVRYVPSLAQRGAHVILECNRQLIPLLKQVRGVEQFVAYGDPLPDFDWQVPMLSLPRASKTTRETIPVDIPYLRADPELIEKWRSKLAPANGTLRVALVWAGTPTHANDRHRSIPLAKLAPMAAVQNVRWYSLQFGPAAQQERPAGLKVIDLTPDVRDFGDTAAILNELDLLVTVDTSPAHVAGAMGRPVWVMMPFNCDWRWMLEGESTPWYPSMRLFRQDRYGYWDSTIARVAAELDKLRPARS
jgi:tetratricopeptide (TPR) repeat protein